jgi:hypothetical protein
MKYFILLEEGEYTIYKVADNLIGDFTCKMEKRIVVEAKDLRETLTKFASLDKVDGLQFNPELKKFKEVKLSAVGEEHSCEHSPVKLK